MPEATMAAEPKSLGTIFYESFPAETCQTSAQRLALSTEANVVQKYERTLTDFYKLHGTLKGVNISEICPSTMENLEIILSGYITSN